MTACCGLFTRRVACVNNIMRRVMLRRVLLVTLLDVKVRGCIDLLIVPSLLMRKGLVNFLVPLLTRPTGPGNGSG